MYLVVNWLAQDFAATQINLKKKRVNYTKITYLYLY